jgi:hypothetical protein
MSDEINRDRRDFFGTAAMTFAAAQFTLSATAEAQTVLPKKPGAAAAKGGTNTSFASLKITMEGDANGAPHPEPAAYARMFSGRYSHRTIKGGIGHNLPQEAPEAFAEAIIAVAADA